MRATMHNQTSCVILADGRSKRRHVSAPYLWEVGGEKLIQRTIRQFSAWADVAVLTSDRQLGDMVICPIIPGSDKSRHYHGIDMIRKGLEAHTEGRMVIVFGDTYFTDATVDLIREGNGKDWAVYGRSGANRFTGTDWAEFFAIEVNDISVYPAMNAVNAVVEYFDGRRWHECTPWEWYHEFEGLPYYIPRRNDVEVGSHWVEVTDLTDDIDYLEDVENLERAIANEEE